MVFVFPKSSIFVVQPVRSPRLAALLGRHPCPVRGPAAVLLPLLLLPDLHQRHLLPRLAGVRHRRRLAGDAAVREGGLLQEEGGGRRAGGEDGQLPHMEHGTQQGQAGSLGGYKVGYHDEILLSISLENIAQTQGDTCKVKGFHLLETYF